MFPAKKNAINVSVTIIKKHFYYIILYYIIYSQTTDNNDDETEDDTEDNIAGDGCYNVERLLQATVMAGPRNQETAKVKKK